jgi:hypothetical protein
MKKLIGLFMIYGFLFIGLNANADLNQNKNDIYQFEAPDGYKCHITKIYENNGTIEGIDYLCEKEKDKYKVECRTKNNPDYCKIIRDKNDEKNAKRGKDFGIGKDENNVLDDLNLELLNMEINNNGNNCNIYLEAISPDIIDNNIIDNIRNRIDQTINRFGEGGITDISANGNQLSLSILAPKALCRSLNSRIIPGFIKDRLGN